MLDVSAILTMKKVKSPSLMAGTNKKSKVHWLSEYLLIKNLWQIGRFRRYSDKWSNPVSLKQEDLNYSIKRTADLTIEAIGRAQHSIPAIVIVHDLSILSSFTHMVW